MDGERDGRMYSRPKLMLNRMGGVNEIGFLGLTPPPIHRWELKINPFIQNGDQLSQHHLINRSEGYRRRDDDDTRDFEGRVYH